MSKIVISTSSFDIQNNPYIERLTKRGMQIVLNPYQRKLSEDEILTLLGNDTIALLAGIEPLTKKVLTAARGLKVIARCGTGLDSVDLEAAHQCNILVSNTPEAPAQAVSELTMGLILSVLRQICSTHRLIQDGQWPRTQGHLLAAQTVGIIGLGHIGRRVATLCLAFGARVIAHDPYLQQAHPDIPLVNFEQLIKEANIISLHIPYSQNTHHLIDADTLNRMKPGTFLINAARGGLIDENALVEALTSGHIAGAALDVFEQEPYQGPLLNCSNVVMTSHMGSLAKESRQRMEHEAAENLLNGLITAGLLNE